MLKFPKKASRHAGQRATSGGIENLRNSLNGVLGALAAMAA
jgi:hypothetical protein